MDDLLNEVLDEMEASVKQLDRLTQSAELLSDSLFQKGLGLPSGSHIAVDADDLRSLSYVINQWSKTVSEVSRHWDELIKEVDEKAQLTRTPTQEVPEQKDLIPAPIAAARSNLREVYLQDSLKVAWSLLF